jgi:large subunit ribosomal protein L35
MPKMKTKRAAAKRYKVSGSGKIVVPNGNRNHRLISKSKRAKRQSRGTHLADKTKQKQAKVMLPYSY